MRVDELYSGWHCVSDCEGWRRKKGLGGKNPLGLFSRPHDDSIFAISSIIK